MATHADLYRFLSEPRNKLAVLGTTNPESGSQTALVGIAVTGDLEILFDTVKSSRKYANLIADPRCSFVCGLGVDATVQFQGVAREVPSDSDLVRNVYFKAFPDGQSRLTWPGIVHFLVRPTWIRMSDYGDTPPRIDEFQF